MTTAFSACSSRISLRTSFSYSGLRDPGARPLGTSSLLIVLATTILPLLGGASSGSSSTGTRLFLRTITMCCLLAGTFLLPYKGQYTTAGFQLANRQLAEIGRASCRERV